MDIYVVFRNLRILVLSIVNVLSDLKKREIKELYQNLIQVGDISRDLYIDTLLENLKIGNVIKIIHIYVNELNKEKKEILDKRN